VRSAMVGGLSCREQAADLPKWASQMERAALVEWGDRLQLPRFEPAILC
jgi:hypothetical protein